MKKNNPIYFLLFILLIMGAFASMAQNSYGLKLIGGVVFVFALVFMVEFITALQKNGKKDMAALIETACLFLLLFIAGCRVFYLHFPFIEWLFGAAAALQMLIYGQKMVTRYRTLKTKNNWLAIITIIFHGSILLFLFSLVLAPFAQYIAAVSVIAAFVLLVIFIAAGLIKKNLLVEGEIIAAFPMVKKYKDHSIIIISLFFFTTLFAGLNRAGVLPDLYSDEFPSAYNKLVNKISSEKEKPINGKYKYEEFMEQYQLFLKHNKTRNK